MNLVGWGNRTAASVRKPLLLDGGLSTDLEAAGHSTDHPLWSSVLLIRDPPAVRDAHVRYFQAGADIATTLTYQASYEGLAKEGIGFEDATEVFRSAVRLARNAAETAERPPCCDLAATPPRPRFVAASCGTYGAMLADNSEYRGNYGRSKEEYKDFHRPRISAFVQEGVDFLAFETMPEIPEALAVVELLKEFPDMRGKAWISFSIQDEKTLRSGDLLTDAIQQVAQASGDSGGVFAVGVNCSSPLHVEGLFCPRATELCAQGGLSRVAYPNTGEIWDPETRKWKWDGGYGGGSTPIFASLAATWARRDAAIIGGCCMVTPAVIHEMHLLHSSSCNRQHTAELDVAAA
eukprot:GHVU01112334.1.p1 GENE.GHVU01112334.1~~GHVU01112334.1.p1  ORF type:complete len:349 (-),score=50.87 GHVU01112334.1:326-1372(-)